MSGLIPEVVTLNKPYVLTSDQILYVEKEYCPEINSFITGHYSELCGIFRIYDFDFCYIPFICRSIRTPLMQRYYTPYDRLSSVKETTSSFPLQYIDGKLPELPALFCWKDGKIISLHIDSSDIRKSFDDIARYIEEKHDLSDVFYSSVPGIDDSFLLPDYYENKADYTFNEEVERLISDVRSKISELYEVYGIKEEILMELLHPEVKLSRMVITNDYRILLTDYGNLEIKMTPLVKAVYFLFLRHPEGIIFKSLPDYRVELLNIYTRLSGRSSEYDIRKSVEDATCPYNNSINEKCARIKQAFISEFHEYLARYYYIDGIYGRPKTIALDRNLVEWQAEF